MVLVQTSVSAEAWYASGTFWSIAAVVVAVVAIVVGAWAAFRSTSPRRVLHVVLDSVVPLRAAPGWGYPIEVRLPDRVLVDPHVVEIGLISHGSRDVPQAAFDGRPLEIDLHTPVIALLDQQVKAGRNGVPRPTVMISPTGLHIGPALLTREHTLLYTLLVDGRPRLNAWSPVADMNLRHDPLPSTLRLVRLIPVALLNVSAIAGLVAAALAPWSVWTRVTVAAICLAASTITATLAVPALRALADPDTTRLASLRNPTAKDLRRIAPHLPERFD
ncbi:hypothetical protein AB0A74_13630 [Saccharothrix sp. NPDC042600]|uniref:hypothetical protein n=1 Tax=Saccharothrix TaxID=2071 RepID=UPI0033D66736|nr:hypothetical protein GCM10017745_10150 [Saccharothrix mutabilis subsp. capreolus]